ncbi:MAG: tail fiber domain-containing protein [Oxalobacteraceae bacterium]|nr:MAG: tail fiber domain-containing protein [Oxalobacteraceae bacterium]
MPYTLRLSDGSVLASIADQKIDKTILPIALVGRGAINYGTDFAENFIHLSENFAHVQPPKNALTGQIWYDTSTNRMRYYAGSWKPFDGDATPSSLPNTVVKRDNSGNFQANIITANLAGLADSAKRWITPRIVSLTGDCAAQATLDGTKDISLEVRVGKSSTADRWTKPITLCLGGQLTGCVTFDGSGDVTLVGGFKPGGIQTDITGNAATATRLQTARAIKLQGDVSGTAMFDGSADAIINATLTGTNVNPGTYTSVTVDSKGRVIAGEYVLIRGEAGQQGAQGPQGPAGPQGPQGVPGTAGQAGTSTNVDTSALVKKAGDTMTGNLTVPAIVMDGSFYLTSSGGNPLIQLNSNYKCYLDRGANNFVWELGGAPVGALFGNGTFSAKGDIIGFNNFSDIRLKSKIKRLDDSLAVIMSLNGYSYEKHNEFLDTHVPEVGVIAQEVETVIPTAVHEHEGTKVVKHEQIIAHLIEAVKTLEARIAELEQKAQ